MPFPAETPGSEIEGRDTSVSPPWPDRTPHTTTIKIPNVGRVYVLTGLVSHRPSYLTAGDSDRGLGRDQPSENERRAMVIHPRRIGRALTATMCTEKWPWGG